MERIPEIGEVVLTSYGSQLLVVGNTSGGKLVVDLGKAVEVSDNGLRNGRGRVLSLKEVLHTE